jgi:hypothetical protein
MNVNIPGDKKEKISPRFWLASKDASYIFAYHEASYYLNSFKRILIPFM